MNRQIIFVLKLQFPIVKTMATGAKSGHSAVGSREQETDLFFNESLRGNLDGLLCSRGQSDAHDTQIDSHPCYRRLRFIDTSVSEVINSVNSINSELGVLLPPSPDLVVGSRRRRRRRRRALLGEAQRVRSSSRRRRRRRRRRHAHVSYNRFVHFSQRSIQA